MARYPGAEWRPLAATQPPKMTRHDLVILHTMGGGSLASTDRNFHLNGYGGLESHFGVGADGTVYQWTDTDSIADANLQANPRAISIETADAGSAFKSWTGADVPAWNPAQVAALAALVNWCCDTHDIPKVAVPDSLPSRRGIAGHRQGINSSPAGQTGYRVAGGELWSDVLGKVCPGDRRFAQIKTTIIPAVIQEDDMPTLDDIAHAVWAYDQGGARPQAWSMLINSNAQGVTPTVDEIAAAVVAALPPAASGGLTKDDVIAAVTQVLTNGTGGTS